MNKSIKAIAATFAVAGLLSVAQAQGGGSGGAGGGAGGSGTPAAGSGTPGSGSNQSPTGGTNNGMSSGKSSATTNTGNSADTGANVRSSPDTSGGKMKKKTGKTHSHAKRANPQMDPASQPMAPNNAN